MPKHLLVRNKHGEPVCACGFRPEILGAAGEKPVGAQWKAKADVLNHVDTARDLPERKPNPSDPFDVGAERVYPRAGVRRRPDGSWLLTLWDGPDIAHELHEGSAEHTTRYNAFCTGQMIIDSHWRAGTRLNGLAA